MWKIFSFIINLIFWLWLFLMPSCILGVIAYYKYYNNPKNLFLPVVILVVGVSLGILLAEFVRRKFGLDIFFGKINASSDFDKLSSSDEENSNSKKEEV
jgi:hypothetical protein